MLKSLLLQKTVSFLSKYHDYTTEELEKLNYGLEGIYLTITKLIVIVFLALILGILKEILVILLLFNIIRYFGFGIHAKKSSECLISSILCFVLLPYILINLSLSKEVLVLIGIISTLLLFIYAPADTIKRPLRNKKKRLFRKIITTMIGTIYLVLAILSNKSLSNILIISILIEAIMINPITYKILNQPYNNYKSL